MLAVPHGGVGGRHIRGGDGHGGARGEKRVGIFFILQIAANEQIGSQRRFQMHKKYDSYLNSACCVFLLFLSLFKKVNIIVSFSK